MTRQPKHSETHLVSRIGWLRAAVLGANDGIVSTASLIVGVAAAATGTSEVLVAGIAGLVAGAMSMAAGEYVSVSSRADTENGDLARERAELDGQPEFELEELTQIYVERGVLIVGLYFFCALAFGSTSFLRCRTRSARRRTCPISFRSL